MRKHLNPTLCKNLAYPTNTIPIFFPSLKLHILAIYRPPSITPEQDSTLLEFISSFALGKEIIILGDFNLPSIDWADESGASISTVDDRYLNLFTTLGLHQHITEATFIPSGNIIDLLLTSDPDRVMDVYILPPFPHCSHALIHFIYTFQQPPPTTNSHLHTYINWPRGNFAAITSFLSLVNWDFEFLHLDVNQMTSHFTSKILELAHIYIPTRKPNTQKIPPWHKYIPSSLKRQRSAAWKAFKDTRKIHG